MKKEINIRLKTLYDKRRTFNFKCSIDSPISILLEKLTIEEEKINGEQENNKEKEKEKIEARENSKEKEKENNVFGGNSNASSGAIIEKKKDNKFERFDRNSQYRIISSNVEKN